MQRDCFRNGSVSHQTISQWRRNAEIFTLHQLVLGRDPFQVDVWLVAAYVERCKEATRMCARVAFAAFKLVQKCFDTDNWCSVLLVNTQVKRGAINDVVASSTKGCKMSTV